MKTKIYVGDRYQGKFTRDGHKMTRLQSWVYKATIALKRSIIVLAVFITGIWTWYGVASMIPAKVLAVDKPVYVTATTTAPVMARIAKCESPTGHYGKDGQVVIHINKDGTTDIGKYQINSVHNAAAHKMGYDLTKESDNEKYAQFLYSTEGTGDWYSSRACWQ